MSLSSYLDALETARPFLRGAPPRRRSLRGRWYRDSLDLCWACVYALEQGPQHFRHLSFDPPSLRSGLERLRELQVARDAAAALLDDTEAELDACKAEAAEQAQEVVRSIECRLRDPQRADHAGLSALVARLRQILERRSERLRGRRRAGSSPAAEALLRENQRLQAENRRLRGDGAPPAPLALNEAPAALRSSPGDTTPTP